MKTTTIVLLLIMLFVGKVNSQELVSSSGEYFETANLGLEWSIGEPFTETFQQGSLILTQGLHQSNFSFTAIDEKNQMEINISIYPNPASEYFFIKTDLVAHNYEITDITGKNILKGEITGKTRINIASLKKSMYFLNIISDDNISVKTFKIIKH